MGKQDATGFLDAMDDPTRVATPGFSDPTPADVIAHARDLGFTFTEADLHSALKERLFLARSLPRGWGWPLARRMGLVRRQD